MNLSRISCAAILMVCFSQGIAEGAARPTQRIVHRSSAVAVTLPEARV